MNTVAVLGVVSLFGGLAALPALSADAVDADLGAVTVHYSRDAMRSQAGVVHLYRDLTVAAREVCAPYDSIELPRQRVYQRCVAGALDQAVRRVHDPALSAYHLQHGTSPLTEVALRG